MEIIEKKDYDQSVKINQREIKCYSKKMMRDLYPSGSYNIIGETFEDNKKKVIDTVILGRKKLNVSEYGKNNKFLYKRKGYFLVGEDEYLVFLQSRLLFLILLIGLLLIGAAAGVIGYKAYMNAKYIAPDYPLPPEDKNSVDIKIDIPRNTETAHKNRASIKVAREVSLDLKTKKVNFIYQNFSASNNDAVVTLCILRDNKEYVIARSGLIKSGKEIKEMSMIDDAINLTQGVYKGRIKIDFYNEMTGEKTATSTNFDDVEVTVK